MADGEIIIRRLLKFLRIKTWKTPKPLKAGHDLLDAYGRISLGDLALDLPEYRYIPFEFFETALEEFSLESRHKTIMRRRR